MTKYCGILGVGKGKWWHIDLLSLPEMLHTGFGKDWLTVVETHARHTHTHRERERERRGGAGAFKLKIQAHQSRLAREIIAKQESRMAKWRTCHELWPLMTFDLRKICKHYATNKTNVSPICMPSFIHTFTIVAEKSAFFNEIPNFFFTTYGPWWPLTFVKGNQYIHFWKAPITYYHCAKFQVSVFNSVWEKYNVKVLGPFSTNYCPLWPLAFAGGNQTAFLESPYCILPLL